MECIEDRLKNLTAWMYVPQVCLFIFFVWDQLVLISYNDFNQHFVDNLLPQINATIPSENLVLSM